MWHSSAIFKQCEFGWIFEILSALIFQLLSLDILCINSNFRNEFVQLAFRSFVCHILMCSLPHLQKNSIKSWNNHRSRICFSYKRFATWPSSTPFKPVTKSAAALIVDHKWAKVNLFIQRKSEAHWRWCNAVV